MDEFNYRWADCCAVCKNSVYEGSDYFCNLDNSAKNLDNFSNDKIWEWAQNHRVSETRVCNKFKKSKSKCD